MCWYGTICYEEASPLSTTEIKDLLSTRRDVVSGNWLLDCPRGEKW